MWTGAALSFGGAGGANELRFADTGAGTGPSIASANWPYTTRPVAGVAPVRELWAYSADAVGLKVATYDGGRSNANVLRLAFSGDGTLASAPRVSSFANSTNPVPVPGTQGNNPTDGANIINGHATDTGSASYLKFNMYGSGMTNAGAQETPAAGAVGTTLNATSGTAGSVSPAPASWLAAWQSAQGWIQYITSPAIPKPMTAFYWYMSMALFMGVNELPGISPFCPLVFDYSFA